MVKHDDILQAINDRKTWEDRQATWYRMRHEGLRRTNKPYPGAADMHFPLGDMLIEKVKPFFVSQLFSQDTLATFTGLTGAGVAHQSAAALWYDYQLKQRSNFEEELIIAIDKMLNHAKGVVKTYWDATRRQLRFEAVNPLHLIVPAHTGRLAEADWLVHVQHHSKEAYRLLARRGFDTSDETLSALCGAEADASAYETTKAAREGITHSARQNLVIVWEVYGRDADGRWRVRTYSPAAPDRPLRPEFGLAYNQGVFGEPLPPPPFFELSAESKDRGYYDARGLMERVAPFEVSLCKDWNTIKDHQTMTSAPQLSAPNGLPPNTQNARMVPGQILPFALQAVQFPPPPMDIGQGMVGTRTTAEQLVGVPDFGTGSQQQAQPGRKTAAEVNLVASVMGQGVDMRSRIFRREVSHGLNLAWALLLQFAASERRYFYLDSFAELEAGAIGPDYRIELNASGDNWNRALVLQKSQMRFNAFRNDPRINQDELYKDLLASDDPRLVKRLFIGAGSLQAAQQEDQAQEISIMLLGWPAEVRPTDDHALHMQSLAGFIQRRATQGEPLSPDFLALCAGHAQAHLAGLKQSNPEQYKSQAAQLTGFIRQLQQAAQPAPAELAMPPAPPMGGAL